MMTLFLIPQNDHTTCSTYADKDGLKLKTKLCQEEENLLKADKVCKKN